MARGRFLAPAPPPIRESGRSWRPGTAPWEGTRRCARPDPRSSRAPTRAWRWSRSGWSASRVPSTSPASTSSPDSISRSAPPRSSARPGSFFRQHRRFGFGDGESRVQGPFYARLAVKYVLGAALIVGGFFYPFCGWLLLLGVALFAASQARRGSGKIGWMERVIYVPLLKLVYDAAYLTGYLRGRLTPPVRSLPDPGSP